MAERRTLLSQASQATEPLRAAPINAPAGAFGDARGLGSFGQSLESAGYQTGQHASRKLADLHQKADAIADARIKAGYSVAVLEANTALTQSVEEAKNQGLRGENLTNFIKARVAQFEAGLDKSMEVLAKQYPDNYMKLVTKEQRAATWAGMQNNQIESGINYTNTKNQEDSLANEVALLNNSFYAVNKNPIATLGTAVLEMAKIADNVLLDLKNKVAFQNRVREHVAGSFSAQIEQVAFPAALESAFEKKVISPQDYATLKHARQAWEKAGGARPGAMARFTDATDQVKTGQNIDRSVLSGAVADALSVQETPAAQFTNVMAPLVIADTVGSFRRRLMGGVNPAGEALSVEKAHQVLARGVEDKDALGLVMSYLNEGVAGINNSPDTPSELKDPAIQKFTQPQIASAYASMFSLVKEQNDLIQSGRGAEAYIHNSTVRAAYDVMGTTGKADGYVKALTAAYKADGILDASKQDISDPIRLRKITDLIKLNTAESVAEANKLTQEYRGLLGIHARESMIRLSSRDDSVTSGVIGLSAEVGPGFNEQNTAQAQSMLATVTSSLAWLELPKTKELLARESVGVNQGIKLLEQRIGYSAGKDDEDFVKQARSDGGFTKFNTELSTTPIGRLLTGNGNLAAVRKVFEAVFNYKRRGPSIGGAMTDEQAANETMALISVFYSPMPASGVNDPNPVYINSPHNNLVAVDSFQQLPRGSALDREENQKRIPRTIDGALLAALGASTSEGAMIQRQWNTVMSTVFTGIHWGDTVRFGNFPNLGSTFLFKSNQAERAGVGLFTANNINLSKAKLLVGGEYVSLSGPGSESLRFSTEVSAAYKAYVTETSKENQSVTIIAQNYTVRHEALTNKLLFYLRPDTLVEDSGRAAAAAQLYVPDSSGNMVPLSLPLASVISYADQMLDYSAWMGYRGAPKDIQDAVIKDKFNRPSLGIQYK